MAMKIGCRSADADADADAFVSCNSILAAIYSSMGEGEDVDQPFLPEDLIVAEILPRLHIKPLFSFRCVSKRYNFIISHPEFGRNYMQRAYNISPELSGLLASITLLFPYTDLSPFRDAFNLEVIDLTDTVNSDSGSSKLEDDDELCCISVNSVSLPFDDAQKILSSSNGLILSEFERLPKGYTGNRPRFGLCVSNPLTKQSVKIPDPDPLFHPGFQFALATRRGCDDHDHHAYLTYKVVGIFPKFTQEYRRPPHRNSYTGVEIFSSDTGCWAPWKAYCQGQIDWLPNSATGCFAYKGVLHWLDHPTGTVLTYDPYNSPDRFERIPLPNGDKCVPYSSLIYSGEEEMLKYCEIQQCPGYDSLSVWRRQLVDDDDDDDSESGLCWCFEGEFQVPSLGYRCMILLVAPNPWNRDVICHPYVLYEKFTVMNPRSGTSRRLNLFTETAKVKRFSGSIGIWSSPLVAIELCPWSSPFYAQPNLD